MKKKNITINSAIFCDFSNVQEWCIRAKLIFFLEIVGVLAHMVRKLMLTHYCSIKKTLVKYQNTPSAVNCRGEKILFDYVLFNLHLISLIIRYGEN